MSSLFGIEASRAAQFAIAFAIILVLVALFGLVLRKLTGARLMMPGSDRGRSRQPRLGIVDVYDLDRQRQLLLLRRDNVEHLLLIGGPNDVVIETNIVRVAGARIPAGNNEAGAERFEPAFEHPPRAPQVEASNRPSIETQLAAQLGAFVRRPSEESDAEQELAPVASASAPVPAHAEPVLKPDNVHVSVAPPAVHGLRAEARTPAAPANAPSAPEPAAPRPESRPAFTPPPFQSRATPVAPAASPPPPPQPAAVPQPEPARASKEEPEVVLSDMAKQLEEALKRPAAPVPAPHAAPAASHPIPEDVTDEDDLLEPGPEDEEPRIPYAETFEEEEVDEEPAPAPEPPRPAVEPVRPAPGPVVAPAPAPAQPAAPPPPPRAAEAPSTPQAAQKASDPFSVDEIEAEFARLLGRPLDSGKKE